MSTSHSPAPWIARACSQGFYLITDAQGHLVCKVPCDRMDRLARASADSRLIESAPFMLDCLANLCRTLKAHKPLQKEADGILSTSAFLSCIEIIEDAGGTL